MLGAKNSRRTEEQLKDPEIILRKTFLFHCPFVYFNNTNFSLAKGNDKQKFSARNKLLDDLKHSNLSNNFHNPDAIQERNQKIAIERTRRKTELQQELMKQIEEKKLEIEKLRAKEKEEDELLERLVFVFAIKWQQI